MRRLILIVPGLTARADEESVLRPTLPASERMAERGSVSKLAPLPLERAGSRSKGRKSTVMPEAAWVGLNPVASPLQQGPLVVAGLGADPPEKSVHFQASLLSFGGDRASAPRIEIAPDDLRTILDASSRLDSRSLTLVHGEGSVHGLVWEDGSLEAGFATPRELIEAKDGIREMLPEGDGEALFRRYIDDSVNLLSELEVNVRREEEGLPALNMLWPWGPGFRGPMPNLALRRGLAVHVESSSLRLAGLARLVGYRHGDRAQFGRGVNVRLDRIFQQFREHGAVVAVVESFADFRGAGRMEEAAWLMKQLHDRVLEPLFELSLTERVSLSLLSPTGYVSTEASVGNSDFGLALEFSSGSPTMSTIPFDERAFEGKSAHVRNVWELVGRALI